MCFLLWVVDINHVIDCPLDNADRLKLVRVFILWEFDFSLLKNALDTIEVILLHLNECLCNESVVYACLVEFLQL